MNHIWSYLLDSLPGDNLCSSFVPSALALTNTIIGATVAQPLIAGRAKCRTPLPQCIQLILETFAVAPDYVNNAEQIEHINRTDIESLTRSVYANSIFSLAHAFGCNAVHAFSTFGLQSKL